MHAPLPQVLDAYPHLLPDFLNILETYSTPTALDTLHLFIDSLPEPPSSSSPQRHSPVHITDRDLRRAINLRITQLTDNLLKLRSSHASLAAIYARANLLPPEPDELATQIKREIAWLKAHLTPPSESLDLTTAKQVPIESLLPPSSPTRSLGNRLTTTCPFHQEKTPSFVIFTNDNHFHCFGCNLTGDAITFVQKLHSLSFKEAVTYLNGLKS